MAQIEFAVNVKCESCEKAIRDKLKEIGVESVQINVAKQQVIVSSSKPSSQIQEAIESTGVLAVLRGQGADNKSFGAAVSILKQNGTICGLVRFNQIHSTKCVIDGSFSNLTAGKHGLHIHEYGDLSEGCESSGDDYNPNDGCHGNRFDPNRHAGDLGNIIIDEKGNGILRYEDDLIKVKDIIGRTLVVHEKEDDFSNAQHGNAGKGIACGIIARSAGLFENKKQVCACSGKTLWEERLEIKDEIAPS